ncbi:MAG: hypothetical protein RSB82_03770 [Victivallaceae bacterium]
MTESTEMLAQNLFRENKHLLTILIALHASKYDKNRELILKESQFKKLQNPVERKRNYAV